MLEDLGDAFDEGAQGTAVGVAGVCVAVLGHAGMPGEGAVELGGEGLAGGVVAEAGGE